MGRSRSQAAGAGPKAGPNLVRLAPAQGVPGGGAARARFGGPGGRSPGGRRPREGARWLWSPALPQAVDVMLAAVGRAAGPAGM